MLLEWKSVNITNDKSNFIFLIGPPGSGKSTIVSEITRELKNVKTYNIDRWLELLAKKNNIDLSDPVQTQNFYTNDNTIKLLRNSKKMFYNNINSDDNILIDLTGRKSSSVLDAHLFQTDNQYVKTLIYVMTPLDQCIDRANKRIRKVDIEYLIKTYIQIQLEFVKYFQNFDYIWIVINDNDRFILKYNDYIAQPDRVLLLKSPDNDQSSNSNFYHKWGNYSGDPYKYVIELFSKINLKYKDTLVKLICKQSGVDYIKDTDLFINTYKDTDIKDLEEFKILNYLKLKKI